MLVRRTFVRIFVCFALVLVAVAASSCNSSSSVGLAQGCSLNSDCNNPLVCVFSKCHVACRASNDCPSGQRCVSGGAADGGAGSVCQLPTESTCAMSTCSGTQVCAADQQCRVPCQTTQNCVGGQVCLSKASMSLCYTVSNPIDNATLVGAGVIGSDGGLVNGGDDGGGVGDATTHPPNDATDDSTVQPGSDGATIGCDAMTSDGACDYCPRGACAHGTCVSGNQDYSCQCVGGYAGSGTKTCSLLNSCKANNLCQPDYPCQPTAPPGQACVGQYATWPVTDTMAPSGGPTVLPSFANNGDGTLTDQVTTLMWQNNVPALNAGCASASSDAGADGAAPTTCTLADSKAYCGRLNLAGHTDWRLPTKIELESILDYSHAQPPYIHPAFLPTPSTAYWTSSVRERSLVYTWYVNFAVATLSSYFTSSDVSAGSVRCVRGTGVSASTAATHYTIRAGAIDAGTGDAGSDDTVLDNWTGLTWERSVGGLMSFQNAQAFCTQLGNGFRIPTIKELLTVVNPILFTPAVDTTTFPNTPAAWFWSSSPIVPPSGSYYTAEFGDGYTSYYDQGNLFNVRCVH